MLPQTLPFLAGGAIGGILGQIKGFARNTLLCFIKTAEIKELGICELLAEELHDNSRVIRIKNKYNFNLYPCYFKDKYSGYDIYRYIHYPKSIFLLYKGYIPIYLSTKNDSLILNYLWGTFNIEHHIKKENERLDEWFLLHPPQRNKFYIEIHLFENNSAKTKYAEPSSPTDTRIMSQNPPGNEDNKAISVLLHYRMENNEKFTIFPNGEKYTRYNNTNSNEGKDNFYFTKEHKIIEKNILFWMQNEQWYRDRKIARRRGILCAGKPGSGKSEGIKKIARKLKLPLHIFYLTGATNKTFQKEIENLSNCVVLFEDIDVIWDGRKNISESSQFGDKLSFDYFLNCLSGVKAIQDCFIILTTNHADKLDNAMLRDGRIDEIIEIKELDEEGLKFIANNILGDWPELIEQAIKEGKGQTGANFENHCVKMAIEKKWEGVKND